jgi:hypothetical protein
MKRTWPGIVIASLFFVAIPAKAQILNITDHLDRVAEPSGRARTVADAALGIRDLIAAHASANQRGGKAPNVINIDDRDSAFLFPITGNVAGANGTYFRSDVSISNYRSITQNISVGFLVQGQDNRSGGLQRFTIPANTTVILNDFVGVTLQRSGLGAVLVFADDPLGNLDSAGQIDGASRIWTPQADNSAGTVSQSFDAVSVLDSIGSLTGYVIGLKQSSAFRTNVGVVNLDTVTHTWTIRSVATGVITTVTVPPLSVSQVGLASGSASAAGNVNLTMQSDGFGFYWSAYGTSVDNVTGDGWVERAKQ